MAGFTYFLPAVTAEQLLSGHELRRNVLQQFGLDQVLVDVRRVPDQAVVQYTPCGPVDQPGVLIYPVPGHGQLPRDLTYDVDRMAGESTLPGGAWLLWDRNPAEQPQPVDLERRTVVPGYRIADRSGRRWIFPAVRGHANFPGPYGALPGDWTFDAGGLARLVLAPEYEALWNETGRIWDHLTDAADRTPITPAELAQIAAAALCVNYRVGPWQLAALQSMGRAVITTANLPAILHSLCDVDSIEEYLQQKKTTGCPSAPGGPGSSAGSPGATQPGDQPAANCG